MLQKTCVRCGLAIVKKIPAPSKDEASFVKIAGFCISLFFKRNVNRPYTLLLLKFILCTTLLISVVILYTKARCSFKSSEGLFDGKAIEFPA